MTTTNPVQWGDRRQLLQKRLTYAFSLDFKVALRVPFQADSLAPVSWPEHIEGASRARRRVSSPKQGDPNDWDTYRVPGAPEFVTATGTRPDVPVARVVHADDQIVFSNRITCSLAGRLLLETDTPSVLRIDYTGVANFKGMKPGASGAERLCHSSGTAFVSSRQEIDNPKYRWLVYNQLIGIGRIAPLRVKGALQWSGGKENASCEGLVFAFSFDFYVGT